jgi:acyl-ACP thioesterase
LPVTIVSPLGHVSAHFGTGLMPKGPSAPCDDDRVPVEYVEVPTRGRVFRGSRRVHLGDVDAAGAVRLEALGRFLQDIATDDADDAGLSDRRGVWVLRSSDLEIVRTPEYHEVVELATFCSGTGPRWAERRTRLVGDRGAVVEAAGLWVFVDRERGRPLPLDDDFLDRFGESAAGRRVRGRLLHAPPPPDASWRPWALRNSDFDVLDHVNNARSLEAVEDELVACLPGRRPVRARIEYRGTLERGEAVELGSAVADDELAVWLRVGDEVRVSATVTVEGRRAGEG